MYTCVSDISKSKLQVFELLAIFADWKKVLGSGRDYHTAMVKLDHCKQAFLLKIPPNGMVHKHIDTERPEKTYHIPLKTNIHCWNFTFDPDSTTHLEVGKVYEFDRQVCHASINKGTTDRIHLIIETNDLQIKEIITNAGTEG